MKKWITIMFTCIIILIFYVVADYTIVDVHHMQFGMMKEYENFEDRMAGSDLVVVATLLEEPENITRGEHGVFDGYHNSKIRIEKVLKGDKTLTNQAITIREPYYTVDKGLYPGNNEFYYGDYTKMLQDTSYILCLGWDDVWNQYGISSSHEGKFNIDGKDVDEKAIEKSNEKVKKLKEEMLENLKEEISLYSLN